MAPGQSKDTRAGSGVQSVQVEAAAEDMRADLAAIGIQAFRVIPSVSQGPVDPDLTPSPLAGMSCHCSRDSPFP